MLFVLGGVELEATEGRERDSWYVATKRNQKEYTLRIRDRDTLHLKLCTGKDAVFDRYRCSTLGGIWAVGQEKLLEFRERNGTFSIHRLSQDYYTAMKEHSAPFILVPESERLWHSKQCGGSGNIFLSVTHHAGSSSAEIKDEACTLECERVEGSANNDNSDGRDWHNKNPNWQDTSKRVDNNWQDKGKGKSDGRDWQDKSRRDGSDWQDKGRGKGNDWQDKGRRDDRGNVEIKPRRGDSRNSRSTPILIKRRDSRSPRRDKGKGRGSDNRKGRDSRSPLAREPLARENGKTDRARDLKASDRSRSRPLRDAGYDNGSAVADGGRKKPGDSHDGKTGGITLRERPVDPHEGKLQLRVAGGREGMLGKLKGTYVKHAAYGGRPSFKRASSAADDGGSAYLYFRDDEENHGWWIGRKPGSAEAFAFHPSDTDMPPRTGWVIPMSTDALDNTMRIFVTNEEGSTRAKQTEADFWEWLLCLDQGRGDMLTYFPKLSKEFDRGLPQIAKLWRPPEPQNQHKGESRADLLDPSFFKLAGITKLGHKFLFLQGIAKLP